MKVFIVGLNHKSAPLNIRERLAFNQNQVLEALTQLKNGFKESEFVLLSTCNRVELYCACNLNNSTIEEDLIKFLSDFHHVPLYEFQEFLYIHNEENAVRHLLNVASSFDSLVIGEAQIISQVKESYRLACSAGSTGKILNRLFHCAFSTGKKVYTVTSISQGRVSIAGVAVELAKQLFADMSSAKVVVIGAGEMGELLVQHLVKIGCRDINLFNRSYERGLTVAQRYEVNIKKWEDISEHLKDADIVISSASVKDYLYTKESFKIAVSGRKKRSLLLIDIAVPRNIEPSVNEIEDVYLYSIDDLSAVVEQNLKIREKDIAEGMNIIHKEADIFMEWLQSMEIGPLIGQLGEKFVLISQKEMDHFFVGARRDASCRKLLEMMVNRILNKLLHCVIKNVDTIAKDNSPTEAANLVRSFVKQAEAIVSETNDRKDTKS
jgi:glutamyl-tRNA reductase